VDRHSGVRRCGASGTCKTDTASQWNSQSFGDKELVNEFDEGSVVELVQPPPVSCSISVPRPFDSACLAEADLGSMSPSRSKKRGHKSFSLRVEEKKRRASAGYVKFYVSGLPLPRYGLVAIMRRRMHQVTSTTAGPLVALLASCESIFFASDGLFVPRLGEGDSCRAYPGQSVNMAMHNRGETMLMTGTWLSVFPSWSRGPAITEGAPTWL
jgi:hypothetical protein